MKFTHYLIIGGLLTIYSCSGEESASESKDKETAQVEWSKVEIDSALREELNPNPIESHSLTKKIKQNDELLANFEISTQELKKEDDGFGQEIINMEVDEWVRSNFYLNEDDYKVKSLDTLLARYEKFLKAESEAIQFATNWEISADASVVYNHNGIIQYALSNYSYTGGAHGNGTLIYRAYDLITGRRLGVTDYFSDTIQVIKTLNETFNATASEELKSSLDVEELPLSKNVVLAKDTLTFFYNTYEVGPYSIGPVEVQVPVKSLKSAIRINLN